VAATAAQLRADAQATAPSLPARTPSDALEKERHITEAPLPPPAPPREAAAATAGAAVRIRVQFVQGRAPLVLDLPLPLPTVGELKRSVHAACGGAQLLVPLFSLV
jgi:hypothetical protein